jgi:rhodanese-related sulfurtransferase
MAGLFARFFGARERVKPVRIEPVWIEPADLHKRLAAGEPLLLLDVRGTDEFTGPLGHISGAVNLPLPELPAHLARLAAAPQPIVALCLTDKRSARAAGQLAAAGHREVAILRGGMERWRREGFSPPV